MNFVLRGIQEQHDLVPSKLVRVPADVTVYDSVYYQYTEFISKNKQHRLRIQILQMCACICSTWK